MQITTKQTQSRGHEKNKNKKLITASNMKTTTSESTGLSCLDCDFISILKIEQLCAHTLANCAYSQFKALLAIHRTIDERRRAIEWLPE